MDKRSKKPETDRPEDSPIAWFAVLQRARTIDNYKQAAHAMSELERLGVTVRFKRHAAEVQQ